MARPMRVLFLCTGNSCRSQMAEGWARHLVSDHIEAYSAGIETHGLNRVAVRVMAEAGVDIEQYRSKRIDAVKNIGFDFVITVCDQASESCPTLPGKTQVLHFGFQDPPLLAQRARSEEEALDHYRRVRDEIRAFVAALPDQLKTIMGAVSRTIAAPEETNMTQSSSPKDPDAVRQAVREGYGAIARNQGSCCAQKASCCGTAQPDAIASQVGYAKEDLAALPEGANMGLSCGNPTAIAALQPGEVVLDLGSGGGFDAFIAGPRVGATGRVIGVDMTPDMIAAARRNMAAYRERSGLDNVEFRLGEIEHLPVPDASVDVIISNCVINLSPDKPQVWRDMFRVLKPGGRVAVSDMALVRPLPEEVLSMVESLVGCVAGAATIEETERMAKAAGFAEIELVSKPENVDAMAQWSDPIFKQVIEMVPAGMKPSDFVTSLSVMAKKP